MIGNGCEIQLLWFVLVFTDEHSLLFETAFNREAWRITAEPRRESVVRLVAFWAYLVPVYLVRVAIGYKRDFKLRLINLQAVCQADITFVQCVHSI